LQTFDYDVIVIGAGAMGAACAWQLARKGASVALFEQFELNHKHGSSHGRSRIFRLAYDDKNYIPLAEAALLLWQELESISQTKLLTTTGGLDIGHKNNKVLKLLADNLTICGTAHERWTAAEIMERFPQFQLSENMAGIFQADAGVIDAELSVATMVKLAEAGGALFFEKTKVESVKSSSGFVEVVAKQRSYRCRRLIIAAGAYVQDLLRGLGQKQFSWRVSEEQYIFLRSLVPHLFQASNFPVWIDYDGMIGSRLDLSMYGFPCMPEPAASANCVKVACHMSGATVTTENRTYELNPAVAERSLNYVRERLPQAFGEIADFSTCLYTNTIDGRFIIDFVDQEKNIVLASPCSGHGFKFSPLIGDLVSDLAMFGQSKYNTELFKLPSS